MPASNLLDDVANDLAVWIDQVSTEVAVAFSAARSPFSAHITEAEKLEFYKSRLFNPDGSPNGPGRDEQLARLGSDGFATVYRAVIRQWPELKPPDPEEISVPDEWPTTPAGGVPTPGLPPGPGPGTPGPGPMLPPGIPAMAKGGIVTRPTLALIGEAGPEAVVPLGQYQYPEPDPGVAAHLTGPAAPDPDLAARLTGAPPAPAAPPTPSHDDIVAYIRQAAAARGIDPNAALQVALHEGTNPKTGRFDSPAERGTFPTGSSWWPFQLHYGGKGTPYEQYGTTAGLGNEFSARTGVEPGDPSAWQAATDFALDQAIANPSGWAQWYGSKPAKVAPRQGLPPVRR